MSKPALRSAAAWLPNLVSVARAALSVPICLLLAEGSPRSIWLALGLFVAAAASDLADGAIARALRATSVPGSHLDPLADKVLVGAPLAVVPFTQNVAFTAPAILALTVFCAAELPKAWERFRLLRQGLALHASTGAKWKTLAQYVGVAAVISGLGPVPWGDAWQAAGCGAVLLASGYAWRSRQKEGPLGPRQPGTKPP